MYTTKDLYIIYNQKARLGKFPNQTRHASLLKSLDSFEILGLMTDLQGCFQCCVPVARLFLGFLNAPASVACVKDVVGVTSCKHTALNCLQCLSSMVVDSELDCLELCGSDYGNEADCERPKFTSDGNSSMAEQILLCWIGIYLS